MVKHTTIAIIQTVIALIAIITNITLQVDALMQLNKSVTKNVDIEDSKRMLLSSILLQSIAAVLMIIAFVILIVKREQLQAHMNKFIYAALIISGLLLLVSGSLGGATAVRLQCYRGDADVNKAWNRASMTSVIGVVGTVLLLLIQVFTRKEDIKSATRDYLTHKYVRVPTHKPVPPPKKAPMPAYHPPLHKRDESL